MMDYITVGMLAHVDAGKTTLSESLLYEAGSIRKSGRVDHGDAFLDYDTQEKQRGITIFSKQAIITREQVEFTFIDTPGHVDFSAEMERTLGVLDYAILVISGVDGVQAHTETIWRLLKHYQIPTFLFINKMDITFKEKQELMDEVNTRLDAHCVDMQDQANWLENVALCEEELLQYYMEHETITDEQIQTSIQQRILFPCYFGSALKMQGITDFLDGFTRYCRQKVYPSEFGAKIFKITRDQNGNRLTHMKITGGSLHAKTRISDVDKVDQIRIYSGIKYKSVQQIYAGQICAVSGIQYLHAGEGLGFEAHAQLPVLSAFMCYRLVLPSTCDAITMMKYLRILAEEDPQLQAHYQEQTQDIQIQVMGEIQIEILRTILQERFHVDVSFEPGGVTYKETITEPVEGVGHYEPLRHYAEVHLLLEPAIAGSGLSFASVCGEDVLERNYQRQILNHLEEEVHLGVLSGSPITDMKITLLGGKAHKKHTEGGDFRQATRRALRHGLKMTNSILLEPFYQYRLRIPSTYVSKAIYDIERMHGDYQMTQLADDWMLLSGSAPVAYMQNYGQEVRSYTKGVGTFFCTLKGYEPCVDAQQVLSSIAYDSERDTEHPTGSVFCTHGAGFHVKWDEVYEYMHIPRLWMPKPEETPIVKTHKKIQIDDAELARVVAKIHGPQKPRIIKKTVTEEKKSVEIQNPKRVCLLVDGYNMIFDWPELKELAKHNLEAARKRLIDVLCNYQGYKGYEVILVFDAYKIEGNPGSITKQDTIHVVYTKTKQTADMYIEHVTHRLANEFRVIVATSDAMEQLIVLSQGAQRISARELEADMHYIDEKEQKELHTTQPQYRNHALADLRNLHKDEQ